MMKPAMAVAAIAILIAACGGTEDDPTTGAGAEITIRVFSFGDPVTVTPGEEVTVVNGDGVAHTWTSVDGVFDSGALDPGAEFSFTFAEPGDYGFFCSIHPSMSGSVIVEG